jgi:hypothetical protein
MAAMLWASSVALADDANRIQPYAENPYYWQYKDGPVLLLGGSWQDNLFNHPIGLEKHLDLLQSVGGNYVRNTMSHRNEGNVFAYGQVDGKFNLDQWNEEYWQRFDNFLKLTHERDIIVQIEMFDRHDLSTDHQSHGGWSKHPFNPANNVTYTPKTSGLPVEIGSNHGWTHPFFVVVPALQDNELVLRYQQAYVDKVLSISLEYPHVLYCIQNESSQDLAFGDYWAEHIHRRAREAGLSVYVTDMRNQWDITHSNHHHIYKNPQRFNFLDVSQNSTQEGQTHWDRMVRVRAMVQDHPRPINNNKIYSGGNEEEAVARMFRIIFAGGASARFHRPHPLEGTDDHEKSTRWGLGLSPRAQTTLQAARMFTDAMNVFACQPRNDLLSERSANEAYCLAKLGRRYAVYFPNGGEVKLDVAAAQGSLQVRWLDIAHSTWQEAWTVTGGKPLELKTPDKGHWVALVLAERQTAVSIDGGRFRINGQPTYAGLEPKALGRLMNVRMVNSTFDDENPTTRPQGLDAEANTTQFIATMDAYRAHGILAFTLNLQGGYPGYEGAVNSAFEQDGSLKGCYVRRVGRAIEAADARGMVVILGLFYQRQDQVLAGEEAVRAATRNAATWIAQNGYTNVLVEIANEYRHGGFDHRILKTEAGQAELMDLVRSVLPKLPVSTSGMGNARFHPALCEAVDFILLHGNETEPEDYAGRIAAVAEYGKPIVFNEDWCFSDDRRGTADASAKAEAAFENGASWGIMNQVRNQHWPFVFGIGQPDEGQNAREDHAAYATIRRLVGTP